jgi:hypothetical protein
MKRFSLLLAVIACVAGNALASDEVRYDRDVRQILSSNCFKCHGPDPRARKRRPRLDTFEGATSLNRWNHYPIVPGDLEKSEVIKRITSDDSAYRMPPADAGRALTEPEIDTIKKWIEQGAEYLPHWSYKKPERPKLPKISNEKWARNGIDHFIAARLDDENLTPSEEADKRTLIRRVYLDVIGLPPTPNEVKVFVKNKRSNAYEKLVDELLQRPEYGERWARIWLDLARYADSKGYEADRIRSIWKFRDWVINALNADMPFTQFTIEQIAGDLLPNPTEDQIIATAFHRNTMNNDEGGTDDEEFRNAAVVDRVNTTMEVWMGTTIRCSECHDHKYDPISQKEFYSMYAFLNQTADADRNDEFPLYVSGSEEQKKAIEANKQLIKDLTPQVAEFKKELEKVGLAEDEKSSLERQLKDADRMLRKAKKEQPELAKGIVTTPIMKELPSEERRKTFINVRGNFLNKGKEVSEATPAVFHEFPEDLPKNRLGLAQWLVDENNPLTARVTANRLWEQFFGQGIVRTLEEFGAQGEWPTHPELLDWLAVEFMENGWSMKKLVRTIVTSATYRQSSRTTPELSEQDPFNYLLARGPRFRLEAEMIRDQALKVGGLLSDEMYGPSVMPYQPDDVWQVVYDGEKWATPDNQNRYRRGLYTFWRRTAPYPSMITFDATSREVCTTRRIRTNTPLQALVTLNDPVYVESAQALARRIMNEMKGSPNKRIKRAFEAALARPASAEEQTRLASLYASERAHFGSNPKEAEAMATDPIGHLEKGDVAEAAAWTVVSNVILNLDEFLTKR